MIRSWMEASWLVFGLLTALSVVIGDSQEDLLSLDDTVRRPGWIAEKVDATTSVIEEACVFPDDKSFMRRLAYVEDDNVTEPFPDGGFWRVDEKMFEEIQRPLARWVLLKYIKNIQKNFDIDWPSMEWKDLRRPFESALAARLYLLYKSRSNNDSTSAVNASLQVPYKSYLDTDDIPWSIEDQAKRWHTHYRPDGDEQRFITLATEFESKFCNEYGADMIFVIDESGDLGASNFQKIKQFVKDVVSSFDIGPKEIRVGLISFSSKVKREFDLNSFTTKAEVLKALDDVEHVEAGDANTYLAIDELVLNGFSEANGARKGHSRIAILLTDTQSKAPNETVLAAARARDTDITMITVGIGNNLNLDELAEIASEPICQHLVLLNNFTEIDNLKDLIRYRIHKAIAEPTSETIKTTTTTIQLTTAKTEAVTTTTQPTSNTADATTTTDTNSTTKTPEVTTTAIQTNVTRSEETATTTETTNTNPAPTTTTRTKATNATKLANATAETKTTTTTAQSTTTTIEATTKTTQPDENANITEATNTTKEKTSATTTLTTTTVEATTTTSLPNTTTNETTVTTGPTKTTPEAAATTTTPTTTEATSTTEAMRNTTEHKKSTVKVATTISTPATTTTKKTTTTTTTPTTTESTSTTEAMPNTTEHKKNTVKVATTISTPATTTTKKTTTTTTAPITTVAEATTEFSDK